MKSIGTSESTVSRAIWLPMEQKDECIWENGSIEVEVEVNGSNGTLPLNSNSNHSHSLHTKSFKDLSITHGDRADIVF